MKIITLINKKYSVKIILIKFNKKKILKINIKINKFNKIKNNQPIKILFVLYYH